MKDDQKIKGDLVTEPKRKLEWLLRICALITGYLFLYIYQNMLHELLMSY